MLGTVIWTGAASAAAIDTSRNLIDGGGPILPTSHTYAIWWGNPSAWPSDTPAGITDFLGGLNKSRYLQTAKEYMRGAALTSTYGRSFSDTSAPPATDPGIGGIGDEVDRVLIASGQQPDPLGIYLVYTANYPSNIRYCAWHSAATIRGVTVAIAFMPNVSNLPRCSVSSRNSYSVTAQSLANVTAHEVLEAITDQIPNQGWVDRWGQENADKCAWQFDGGVPVGSTRWRIQKEWSNAAGHCVQQGPRPPH